MPDRGPLAVGLKVTVTVQLLPGARLAAQCGSLWKSLQFVPRVAKPKGSRKLAAAVPVFFNVKVCGLLVVPTATLPKLSDDGDSVSIILTVPLPLPLSGSLCGPPGELSQIVTVPDLAPAEVGVNFTLSLHEAPETSVPGQLLPS